MATDATRGTECKNIKLTFKERKKKKNNTVQSTYFNRHCQSFERSLKHVDAVCSISDVNLFSRYDRKCLSWQRTIRRLLPAPKTQFAQQAGCFATDLKKTRLVDHRHRDRQYFKLCSTMKRLFCITNLQPAKSKTGRKCVWTCNFTTTAIISLHYLSSVVLLQHKRHIRQSDSLLIPLHLQGG